MWRFATPQDSRGEVRGSIDWLRVLENDWRRVSERDWLLVSESGWLCVSESDWLCASKSEWLRVSERVRLCTINRNARGERASTSRGDHGWGSQE